MNHLTLKPFSSLGHSFFAFLIAIVFKMLVEGSPVGNELAQRCVIVSVLSYVGETICRLFSFVEYLKLWLNTGFAFDIGLLSIHAMTFFTALVPLLYAIAISVLFRHFSQMVSFQSEVA